MFEISPFTRQTGICQICYFPTFSVDPQESIRLACTIGMTLKEAIKQYLIRNLPTVLTVVGLLGLPLPALSHPPFICHFLLDDISFSGVLDHKISFTEEHIKLINFHVTQAEFSDGVHSGRPHLRHRPGQYR